MAETAPAAAAAEDVEIEPDAGPEIEEWSRVTLSDECSAHDGSTAPLVSPSRWRFMPQLRTERSPPARQWQDVERRSGNLRPNSLATALVGYSIDDLLPGLTW